MSDDPPKARTIRAAWNAHAPVETSKNSPTARRIERSPRAYNPRPQRAKPPPGRSAQDSQGPAPHPAPPPSDPASPEAAHPPTTPPNRPPNRAAAAPNATEIADTSSTWKQRSASPTPPAAPPPETPPAPERPPSWSPETGPQPARGSPQGAERAQTSRAPQRHKSPPGRARCQSARSQARRGVRQSLRVWPRAT